MTIQKRSIPLPIGAGVDEGASDVLFDPPAMREVVNARLDKTGRYSKRFGSTNLGSLGVDTSTYGEHAAIAEQDGRIVLLTQLGAYIHDPAKDTWVAGGNVGPRPSTVRVDSFVRQNNPTRQPDVALVTVSSKTVACVAWGDADTLECWYLFAEIPSDGGKPRILSGPTMFSGTRDMSFNIRLTTVGTTVYAVARDAGTDAWCSSCDTSSTYTFSSPTSVNPGWGSVNEVRALFNDGTYLYVLGDEGVNSYSIRRLNTSFVEQASQIVAREALDACLVGSTIAVICADGSLDTVASTLGGAPTNTVVTTPGASGPLFNGVTRGTICEAPSSGYFLVWERNSSVTAIENTGVVTALVTSGLAVSSVGVAGTVRLLTRASYRSAEGVPLVGLIDDVAGSTFRMGYLARPATDVAGNYTLAEVCRFGQDVVYRDTNAVSPSIAYDSASRQWVVPFAAISDATTAAFLQPIIGINMALVSFSGRPRHAVANSTQCFSGGCGVTYTDGVAHAEVSPSPIGIVGNALTDLSGVFVSGFGAVPGVDAKIAVRWRDSKGNLHRSLAYAAGVLNPWVSGGGPADDEALRISFPRPFPGSIRGDRGADYEVEVYVLHSTDGNYYLNDVCSPAAHPSKPGIDYILISDNLSTHPIAVRPTGADYIADVNKSNAGSEYWGDSGELVHVPPPPTADIASTQSRVWVLSAENGRLDVFPSKKLVRGYAPEFPTANRVILPDEGGECTALAALDDKVVVFKERLIYVLFGDPGENDGTGSTLATPRLVASDVGCVNAQSVVEGPFGVVFQSSEGGFHLLGRGLEVTHVGKPIEDTLAAYSISSGVLVADQKEVRWTLRDTDGTPLGTTLVWDYASGEAGAWMTYTGQTASCATTRKGLYAYAREDGPVAVERETWSSLDTFNQKLTSAWVKMAGVAGFQRVWKTVYTFRWLTGGIIIRLGYDFNPSYTDTRTWTPANLAALDLSDGTVTLTVHHTIQKCRAFRWQIEEVSVDGQTNQAGQGFSLLGVQMECGVKRGSFAHALAAGARK